jgi:alpha-glucosidase
LKTYRHDGSASYVGDPAATLGQIVMSLRGPAGPRHVVTRHVVDRQPRFSETVVDGAGRRTVWSRAPLARRDAGTHRFLVVDAAMPGWLTDDGLPAQDVPDDTPFRLVAHPSPPASAAGVVMYGQASAGPGHRSGAR